MKLQRPSFESSVAAVAAIAITGVIVRVQAWFLEYSLASIGYDEGHIAAFAERLITQHWLPYVDATCHRGPLLYWYAAVMQWLWGTYSWVGLRVASLLAASLGVFMCFVAGWSGRRPLAGVMAGAVLVFLTCTAMDVGDGVSLQGEHVAVPPCMASFALVAFAILRSTSERRVLILLGLAGFLASVSALAKQTAALIVIPLLIWIFAWSFSDDATSLKTRTRRLGVFLAGWALPVIAIVIRYAAARELSTFFYWYYTYNKDVYMGPYAETNRLMWLRGFVRDLPIIFISVVVALGSSTLRPLFELDSIRPRGWLRAYHRVGFEATCGLIGSLMLISILATLRAWPHYWIVVIPWAGMAAGLHAESALLAAPLIGRRIGYAVVSLLLIALSWTAADIRVASVRNEKKRGLWAPARPDAICDAIDKYTQPDEGIFVWGFDADLYVSCRRHTVSRYVTLHFVAGIVPAFWTEPSMNWVARDSRAILVRELTDARTPLILDIPEQLRGFSMTRVPELKALLNRDYCYLSKVSGRGGRSARFYLRRDRPECAGKR